MEKSRQPPPHRSQVLTVTFKQAVLLTPDPHSPIPSQDLRPSGIPWVRSPLQWRDRAGFTPDFPIKPRRAPVPTIFNSLQIYYMKVLYLDSPVRSRKQPVHSKQREKDANSASRPSATPMPANRTDCRYFTVSSSNRMLLPFSAWNLILSWK